MVSFHSTLPAIPLSFGNQCCSIVLRNLLQNSNTQLPVLYPEFTGNPDKPKNCEVRCNSQESFIFKLELGFTHLALTAWMLVSNSESRKHWAYIHNNSCLRVSIPEQNIKTKKQIGRLSGGMRKNRQTHIGMLGLHEPGTLCWRPTSSNLELSTFFTYGWNKEVGLLYMVDEKVG